MANIRVFPPPDGLHNSITINGRTYTAAPGSYLDMPDFDAQVACSSGWTAVTAPGTQVGPTASRPTSSPSGRGPADLRGLVFIDTTLGAVICHDGLTWRNVLTGASA